MIIITNMMLTIIDEYEYVFSIDLTEAVVKRVSESMCTTFVLFPFFFI